MKQNDEYQYLLPRIETLLQKIVAASKRPRNSWHEYQINQDYETIRTLKLVIEGVPLEEIIKDVEENYETD